ncbi:uncharacterized protein LOC119326087 isoform X2 [Triticum dicoccoides]|uniref:uncharacterized protein LOC119326087 isoform X2 n=1 Tax=Triticum dicoccoides TaxID=85692 RepID=UPI00189198E6|nr:uncharacterized protein LOC119326087 isoform X2 [Triticum dicoccoides]
MEATAAASLARTLASSLLPRCSRRSRVRVAVAPERRRRGRAVLSAAASTGNYMVPPSSKTSRLVLRLMAVAQRVSHLTTTAACRPSLLPSMATATSGVSRLSAAAGNNDGDVGLQDPIPASVGICLRQHWEFGMAVPHIDGNG